MTRRVHVHYLAVGGVTPRRVLPLSLLLERADRPHPSATGALVGWQSYAVAARVVSRGVRWIYCTHSYKVLNKRVKQLWYEEKTRGVCTPVHEAKE